MASGQQEEPPAAPSAPTADMESGRMRNRSCGDLMEFVCDESNMVKQFSPCKLSSCNASPPHLGPRQLFGGEGSPTAVTDRTPYTASQPSSATSSLAAALADLQVSSRHSSASDLGDRSCVLAFAGHQQTAAAARPGTPHFRSASGEEELPALSHEGSSLCSHMLIGAVRCFDTIVLKTLTPIKTRSRMASSDDPSPPQGYAETLVSPFSSGLKPKGPMGGCPMVIHSRGSSGMAAPGAYNPYDLTTAALSREFRSPAKSMYSPYPSSSRTSASATPNQWGSGSYRGTSYRAAAAQAALARAKEEDEPDFYVSVPGVRRQQSMSQQQLAVAAIQQQLAAADSGSAMAATAVARLQHHDGGEAPGAASPTPLQHHPSGGAMLRQVRSGSSATLGSGTTVHGFKGLFRSVIAHGSSQ